jgi:hypothetical protein
MAVWRSCVYGLHALESKRVLKRHAIDHGDVVEPWRCRGAKEALGVVRLLYSDTLSVRLCRLGHPPLGAPSGGFLVAKEASSRG